ncbi:MAG: hypothetical protein IMF11_18335 [Proteobacteria bacterium]|nr:hypothetical protein [Pseudomonadota bacterium]
MPTEYSPIAYERFLTCHFVYMEKYKAAKAELDWRRQELYKSLDSLICHPDTGENFKTHLLEVRRNV